MRLFMASQPVEVVSLGNTCETGVDVAGGIVCRNAEQQLGVVSLYAPSSSQSARLSALTIAMSRSTSIRAPITRRSCGPRTVIAREVAAGTEAYALCYEMADLEHGRRRRRFKRELLDYVF